MTPRNNCGGYYLGVLDYIHLNPVRAGLAKIGVANGLLEYPWSSLRQGYAQSVEKRAPWLEVAEGLHSAQCPDNARGRQQFVEREKRGQAINLDTSIVNDALSAVCRDTCASRWLGPTTT